LDSARRAGFPDWGRGGYAHRISARRGGVYAQRRPPVSARRGARAAVPGSAHCFGYVPLVLGGVIVVTNIYCAFLKYPLYKLTGRLEKYRWNSGVPLIGSLLLVAALVLAPTGRVAKAAVVLLLIDPGGLLGLAWLLVSWLWRRRSPGPPGGPTDGLEDGRV
jgi:hypothetical protein